MQILCQVGDKLNNKEVLEMVGVSRQRVGELRRALLESRDLCAVVNRAKTAPGTTRKVRSGKFVATKLTQFKSYGLFFHGLP